MKRSPTFPLLAAAQPRAARGARAASALHSPRAWAVAGALGGALLAALIWAPASWLASGVQSASAGKVLLQEARGTVWNGSARLVLAEGAGSRDRTALPTRLQWTLRPGFNGLNMSLHSDCCTSTPMQAKVSPGWNAMTVQVQDSVIELPAELLAGLGTPWNTVALQGQLRLSTQALQLQYRAGRAASQGLTRLEALAVSSRLSPLKPLGSYRLDIQGGDSPRLNLSTLAGDLQLSGQGQWVDARLHFNGEASASPEREAALSNLLNILGRRQGARSIITFG
ncbi:type II secretion system protein N [Comamonas testosteroni]|uniref:Type II secretion system protein N n=1 Tax=Comamonas testosteroni TaxID=285 RepID=A0A373FEY1_COMTE|nr:type II secretion system protein N [Comamonas testosteroni]RGE42703.1 type II secretion system protein N [Comamonas testosteroni]